MQSKSDSANSFSPSVEVKNAWSYTSASLYFFVVFCLIKVRKYLIFYFSVQIKATEIIHTFYII